MRVAVHGRIVPMFMRVLFSGAGLVTVLMMRIMVVAMVVFQRLVPVSVRMHLEDMEQQA